MLVLATVYRAKSLQLLVDSTHLYIYISYRVCTGSMGSGVYSKCGQWSVQEVLAVACTGSVDSGGYMTCGQGRVQEVWVVECTGSVGN